MAMSKKSSTRSKTPVRSTSKKSASKASAKSKAAAAAASEQKVDRAWLKDHVLPTPMMPQVYTSAQVVVLAYFTGLLVSMYGGAASSSDFTEEMVWYSHSILAVYSYLMCSYVFPRYPAPLGIPFLLLALVPGFVICAWPFFGTEMGDAFAKNVPFWVLLLWGALRIQFESCVQMHSKYGVNGISTWLYWPTQKSDRKYTLSYLGGLFEIARKRGGNPDASGMTFIGLPAALITYIMSPNGENDVSDPFVYYLNVVVQTMLLVNLCWGPFLHICGGMPGMTTKNILHNNGSPKKVTQMHGMFHGILGVFIVPIASFAVIHTLVFYKKVGVF